MQEQHKLKNEELHEGNYMHEEDYKLDYDRMDDKYN